MQNREAVPALVDRADIVGQLRRERQDGEAVLAGERARPDDDERVLRAFELFDEAVTAGRDLGQRLGASAEIFVRIGEIHPLADQGDRRRRHAPALADAHVDERRLEARVRTHDQDRVRILDACDGRVEQIGPAAMGRRHQAAVLAGIDIRHAEALHQALEREQFLDGGEIARDGADALPVGDLHARGDDAESLLPGGGTQASVDAHERTVETLEAQAVDDVAGLVGDPFLVHRLVHARQNAHDLAAAGIDADGRADRIHHVDRIGLRQFPGTIVEGFRLVGQRAHRAEIGGVRLQFGAERLLEIARDLHVLAAPDRAEILDARHFRRRSARSGCSECTGSWRS